MVRVCTRWAGPRRTGLTGCTHQVARTRAIKFKETGFGGKQNASLAELFAGFVVHMGAALSWCDPSSMRLDPDATRLLSPSPFLAQQAHSPVRRFSAGGMSAGRAACASVPGLACGRFTPGSNSNTW